MVVLMVVMPAVRLRCGGPPHGGGGAVGGSVSSPVGSPLGSAVGGAVGGADGGGRRQVAWSAARWVVVIGE